MNSPIRSRVGLFYIIEQCGMVMHALHKLLIVISLLVLWPSFTLAGTYQPLANNCDGFPQLPVVSIKGTCLGLVAQRSTQPLFKMPRTLVQTADNKLLIVDMGGWVSGRGQLLLLDYKKPGSPAKVLLSKLNLPHKILFGPKGKIYLGEANRIQRFEWKNDELINLQTVVDGLPYRAEYLHPLKNFIFDAQGNLLVNIGSSSDRCEKKVPLADCIYGVEASIRRYSYNKDADSYSTQYETVARGLRNSMALAIHHSGTFLQAENSMDFPDANEPYEELNIIQGNRFYGWPVCYNLNVGVDGKSCREANYQQPWTLLPPHVAPLDMLYYQHKKLPQLTNKLLMSWHGYRVVGNRLVAYDIDEQGRPTLQQQAYFWRAPEQANGEYTKHLMQPTGGLNADNNTSGKVAQHQEIISQWHPLPGVRPEGAPVGLTIANDGSIFIVDDRNAAILRLSNGNEYSPQQISSATVDETSAKTIQPPQEVTALLQQRCAHCHNELIKQGSLLLNSNHWLQRIDGRHSLLEQRVFIDKVRPMPADGQLMPAEKMLLQHWLKSI